MPDGIERRPARDWRERSRRRRTTRNRVFVALAVFLAFGIGIALGQALHDNPRPGGLQTSLRTVPPPTQTGVP
jgi:hypothetical protein